MPVSQETSRPVHMRGHDLREIRKDRHSASQTSHCVASHAIKKHGCGGKFTWGSYLDNEGPSVIDKKDPNYDTDEANTPTPKSSP